MLIVFLTIHMIVVHYPPFHIDFNQIIIRMADPLWKAIDIAFLFFVLLHALTGAYMVLTDIQQANKFRKVIAALSVVIGVVAFIYGTQTVLAFELVNTAIAP
jgi:succinate dehydrogenase hydrophobic anchor subunit